MCNVLNKKLKIKLFILSLIFPISFGLIGLFNTLSLHNTTTIIYTTAIGLFAGIVINIICYNKKIFTIILYKTPIPLALSLLVWWISNLFFNSYQAILFASIGLLLGLWLNKEIITPFQFYKINKRILAIIYIFFSIITVNYFIKFPAINILLGIIAGNYLSIRAINNYKIELQINSSLKQGSLYTSLVLFTITTISFIIAMYDINNSIALAKSILHIDLNRTTLTIIITAGSIFIVILQYFITLFTARTMLQVWKTKRFSRYLINRNK
jgi:hypothetical protein